MEFFHPISLSEALQKIGDKDNKFGMKYSKGSGSLRSFFGLRFSENLKFLILCGLHSHNKGNTPLLPRLCSNICLHVHCCHGDADR